MKPTPKEFITEPTILDKFVFTKERSAVLPGDWVWIDLEQLGRRQDANWRVIAARYPDGVAQVREVRPKDYPNYEVTVDGDGKDDRWWLVRMYIKGWIRK